MLYWNKPTIIILIFLGACLNVNNGADHNLSEGIIKNDSLSIDKNKDIRTGPSNQRQYDRRIDSLIVAVINNDVDLAYDLLKQGTDVNGKVFKGGHYWESPLGEAIQTHNHEIVKLLVENGADPNLDLGAGLTPFHRAAGAGSMDIGEFSNEIFKLLLEKGGEVNTFNKFHNITPLMTAIGGGNVKNAITLIQNGAAIEPDSINGFQSPIGMAVRHLEYEIATALITYGANVNTRYSEPHGDCVFCPEEVTVLHTLVSMYRYADKGKLKRLLNLVLSKSPDLNIESSYGYTPLEFAMLGNNYGLIEKLIKNGAKLETKGYSAIHLAAQFSNYQMVNFLLQKGIDVNIQDQYEKNTALILCLNCCGDGFGEGISIEDRVKTVELLLDNGADPTIKNSSGESFIEMIKIHRYPKLTSAMIARGLIINEANDQQD